MEARGASGSRRARVCGRARMGGVMIIDGPTGSFDVPDDASDLASLTATWAGLWGDAEPAGDALRRAYPHRWLRFHTLPDGARPAADEDDRAEVRRRQHEVLSHLLRPEPSAGLVAIAEDWGAPEGSAGWSAAALPARRAWRRGLPPDPTTGDTIGFFWADTALRRERADLLLELAATGDAHVVIATPHLPWLLAPYDGGMDVFLIDPRRRESLRTHGARWLSPRPDGL